MTNNPLLDMARHTAKNQKFIAYLIQNYTEVEAVTWDQIAKQLNISLNQLAQLALCKRPRNELHRQDLEQIAKYAGIELNELAEFIVYAENLIALQATNHDQFLLAARDKDDEEKE
jgi:hypothetical protein